MGRSFTLLPLLYLCRFPSRRGVPSPSPGLPVAYLPEIPSVSVVVPFPSFLCPSRLVFFSKASPTLRNSASRSNHVVDIQRTFILFLDDFGSFFRFDQVTLHTFKMQLSTFALAGLVALVSGKLAVDPSWMGYGEDSRTQD